MKRRREAAWKRLLRSLQTGSKLEAVEASKALSRCRSRNGEDALVQLMLDRRSPEASEWAAYSLTWRLDRRFLPSFIACLRDQWQHEAVRGQAAEGLGTLLDCSATGDRGWLAAESALLDSLTDPSPTVRFWCCFALGCLRSARAVAPLEKLRDEDQALIPGWWYVREEAADALNSIAGGPGLDLIPMHLRPAPTLTPRPGTG